MLYYKANSNRKPQFQTYVEILENKRVCKGALHRFANDHIDQIYKNSMMLSTISDHFDLNYEQHEHQVECDLIEGKSFSELMLAYLHDKDYDQFMDGIKWFYDELCTLLPDCEYEGIDNPIFGIIPYHENYTYTKVCNLDFNFDNIFLINDTYKVIDCEWCLDAIIPKQFIFYRSILYLYVKYGSIINDYMRLDQMLALFHIESQDIILFSRLEDAFQKYVYGNDREYNFIDQWFDHNRENNIQRQGVYGQLFYDDGSGFSEANSIIIDYDCHIKNQQLLFNINKDIVGLRLDLANIPVLLRIENIEIKSEQGILDIKKDQWIHNGYDVKQEYLFLTNDAQMILQIPLNKIEYVMVNFEVMLFDDQQSSWQYLNDHVREYMDQKIQEKAILENRVAELEMQNSQLTQDINRMNYYIHHPARAVAHKIKEKVNK